MTDPKKPAWLCPGVFPKAETFKSTQKAVFRYVAGLPASTGTTPEPLAELFPVSSHKFAVCHCGQMKYDRETLQWWKKARSGAWVFVGDLQKRRVTPKNLRLMRNSPKPAGDPAP